MNAQAGLATLLLTIVSCGDDDPDPTAAHPTAAHPALECRDDERSLTPPSELDISGPGAATAGDALRDGVRSVVAATGGEVLTLSDLEYAVVVDGRVVHVSRAAQYQPTGDWHVIDTFYCESVDG